MLCVFIYCGDGLAQDYEKWYYIEPFGLGLGLPNYLELNFLRGGIGFYKEGWGGFGLGSAMVSSMVSDTSLVEYLPVQLYYMIYGKFNEDVPKNLFPAQPSVYFIFSSNFWLCKIVNSHYNGDSFLHFGVGLSWTFFSKEFTLFNPVCLLMESGWLRFESKKDNFLRSNLYFKMGVIFYGGWYSG